MPTITKLVMLSEIVAHHMDIINAYGDMPVFHGDMVPGANTEVDLDASPIYCHLGAKP